MFKSEGLSLFSEQKKISENYAEIAGNFGSSKIQKFSRGREKFEK